MTVEMVGGGFELVKFTLNPPKPSRGVMLSGEQAAAGFPCKTACNNVCLCEHVALLKPNM